MRLAVESAQRLTNAWVGYDAGLGHVTTRQITREEKTANRERAEQALELSSSWREVRSGHLPLLGNARQDTFRPWDASLRVARSEGCSLWCDDLALREMAEAEGIPAFSTWALHEALADTETDGYWLSSAAATKRRVHDTFTGHPPPGRLSAISHVPVPLVRRRRAGSVLTRRALWCARPWERMLFRV